MKILKMDSVDSIKLLRISEGLFISISDGSKHLAVVLEKVDEVLLKEIVAKAEDYCHPSHSLWTVKAVGDKANLTQLGFFLQDLSVKVAKKKERNDEFSVLYNSLTGAFKLSKLKAKPIGVARGQKIKLLIVEDSKTIRTLLENVFQEDHFIEVVASVETAEEGIEKLEELKPDVMTLDLNLPGIGGVELLRKLGPEKMIPTVLVTSMNINDGSLVFDALDAGAVDYIQKPEFSQMGKVSGEICQKVKAAALANMEVHHGINQEAPVTPHLSSVTMDPNVPIFIGSSTGGTVALQKILEKLPSRIPPILIVQHIPAVFSKSLAERLNDLMSFSVSEAKSGDVLKPNHVYIAPGGYQMALKKANDEYFININDDAPVNRFKPSVDYFFSTVVKVHEGPKIGAILTGMGKDGAQGLLSMKNAGAMTLAQSEKTCVVFGMPKAAIGIGAVDEIVDLNDIAERLSLMTTKAKKRKRSAS